MASKLLFAFLISAALLAASSASTRNFYGSLFQNELEALKIIEKFDYQCQHSILNLYIYMSTSLDQIKSGPLSPEDNQKKVAELVHSLTENCHEELQDLIENPREYLSHMFAYAQTENLLDAKISALNGFPIIWQDVALFVIGFGAWYDFSDNLAEYGDCFNNAKNITGLVEEIDEDVRKGTVRGVLEALQVLLPLYDELITASQNCAKGTRIAKEQFNEFVHNLNNLDFDRRFLISILQSYPDLHENFSQMLYYCRQERELQCGKLIAECLNLWGDIIRNI